MVKKGKVKRKFIGESSWVKAIQFLVFVGLHDVKKESPSLGPGGHHSSFPCRLSPHLYLDLLQLSLVNGPYKSSYVHLRIPKYIQPTNAQVFL